MSGRWSANRLRRGAVPRRRRFIIFGESGRPHLLCLLTFLGLFIYIPLEAFDGDAQEGLDEVVLEAFSSRGDGTSPPLSPVGPAPACNLTHGLAPAIGEADSPTVMTTGRGIGRVRDLRASRLCAQSRIAEVPVSQPHVTISHPWDACALPAPCRSVGRAHVFLARNGRARGPQGNMPRDGNGWMSPVASHDHERRVHS